MKASGAILLLVLTFGTSAAAGALSKTVTLTSRPRYSRVSTVPGIGRRPPPQNRTA